MKRMMNLDPKDFDNVPDSALASSRSTWETETPKLPDEDIEKCYKIIEDLMMRYQKRAVKDVAGFWQEVQGRATHKFQEIGIMAHVEIVVRSKHIITQQVEDLRLATTDKPRGYVIHEGEFLVPNTFEPMVISPVIVIDDFEDIERKKEKAEQAIEERNARRSRGDSYFPGQAG